MPTATPAAAHPAEERLLNLVVALMASRAGLTKASILRVVSGYREQAEAGAAKAALEKMFERDKDGLRALGVPIETIADPADPNDVREARYRIPVGEYALPDDVTFTPAEMAVLDLAGAVWEEGSLADSARSGLRKIRSLGIDVDEPILGFAPRISVHGGAFAVLERAIEDLRCVRFRYLVPGHADASWRDVAPLALVDYEGRWHVYGQDRDRDAPRTFLLSRIAGAVTVTGDRFDPALRVGAGDRARAGLDAVAAAHRAVLEVTPGTEAALRLRRRGCADGTRWEVPYVDAELFADELASYGPEVRVVAPPELVAAVVGRLRAVVAGNGSS